MAKTVGILAMDIYFLLACVQQVQQEGLMERQLFAPFGAGSLLCSIVFSGIHYLDKLWTLAGASMEHASNRPFMNAFQEELHSAPAELTNLRLCNVSEWRISHTSSNVPWDKELPILYKSVLVRHSQPKRHAWANAFCRIFCRTQI